MTTFTRQKLADIAEAEAKKNLEWTPSAEARKYTRDFESVFGAGRFAWCGAFTHWCVQEAASVSVPIAFKDNFGFTWASVEGIQQDAIEEKNYIDNAKGVIPERGDLVIFDWEQWDINQKDENWDSHVGIFLHMKGDLYICAEGNTGNMTAVKARPQICIQGFIRIPDGYDFGGAKPMPAPAVSPTTLAKGTAAWYEASYKIMTYDTGFEGKIAAAAALVNSLKNIYWSVAQAIGCPWYFVGAIHHMEADCNLRAVLHNGEQIIGTGRKTSMVPVGRGPFSSWAEAAIDALTIQGYNHVTDWSLGNTLRLAEQYNGRGYLMYHTGENSPYLWAETSINDGHGKYVLDGKWDENADANGQTGFAAIIKEMEKNQWIKL